MENRVLIVDDTARWRDTLADTLFDLDIEVEQAAHAGQALEALQRQRYHLALVDVFLDQVGFDQLSLKLIQQIHQDYPKTTVMAVSGRALSTAERQQLRDLGVISLFEKSTVTLRELCDEVNAAIQSYPYRIFITYRREDGQGFAALLRNVLNDRLGARSAFMDIFDIEGGETWDENIRQIIPECEAMVVILGKQWVDLLERNRLTAMSNPQAVDYVKVEIEIALGRGISIIPVLIDGASMPDQPDSLPSWHAALAGYQAIPCPELRHVSATVDEILKHLHLDDQAS
jgi:CheY-like chemotaxis protein